MGETNIDRAERLLTLAGAAGITVAALVTVAVLWLSGVLPTLVPTGQALAALVFATVLVALVVLATRVHTDRTRGRGRA